LIIKVPQRQNGYVIEDRMKDDSTASRNSSCATGPKQLTRFYHTVQIAHVTRNSKNNRLRRGNGIAKTFKKLVAMDIGINAQAVQESPKWQRASRPFGRQNNAHNIKKRTNQRPLFYVAIKISREILFRPTVSEPVLISSA
jgi:hypothetical protein